MAYDFKIIYISYSAILFAVYVFKNFHDNYSQDNVTQEINTLLVPIQNLKINIP